MYNIDEITKTYDVIMSDMKILKMVNMYYKPEIKCVTIGSDIYYF
jgi:hypothetical protein